MESLADMTAEKLAQMLPNDCFDKVHSKMNYEEKIIKELEKVGIVKFDWFRELYKKFRINANAVLWLILEFIRIKENMKSPSFNVIEETNKKFIDDFNVTYKYHKLHHALNWWVMDNICPELSVIQLEFLPIMSLIKWLSNCLYLEICTPHEFIFWRNIALEVCVLDVGFDPLYLVNYEI